ncbi:MAG: hypothetical protein GX254_07930 [Clostridiales bacterium]|jgi:hypothetical protein|nr:hypothetical protein [Clostridiales bacterium]
MVERSRMRSTKNRKREDRAFRSEKFKYIPAAGSARAKFGIEKTSGPNPSHMTADR